MYCTHKPHSIGLGILCSVTVPGWDSPYLILSAAEPTCSYAQPAAAYWETQLNRFTIFQYHVKANKLLVHTYPRRLVSTYLHNTRSLHWPPALYFTPSTEYIVVQTDVFRLAYWFIFFLNVSLCSQSNVTTDILWINSAGHLFICFLLCCPRTPPPPQRFEVMGVIGFLGFSKLRFELKSR